MKVEYNNLYTHFVFTSMNRQACIQEASRERLEKYITGIVNNNGCQLYAIYANPDHVHLLVSRSPGVSEQRLATIITESSQRFIHTNKLVAGNFQWQQSCSAFSVSKSHVDKVCKYILNQQEHHRRYTFAEEYEEFIKHYQQSIQKASDGE